MSVDKFGRFSNGRRVGLKLTKNNDYDMQKKLVKFVKDPVDSEDVVNLRTLKATTLPSNKLKISAQKKRIVNVNAPQDATDAATKGFVEGLIPLKNTTNSSYSVHQFNIKDVAYPKSDGDAVNLKYIKDNCLVVDANIDAKNKIITNIQSPVKASDAVTLNFIKNNTLFKDKNKFDAQKCTISNLNSPVDMDDGVSKRYLKEVLGELGYTIYSKVHSGRANLHDTTDWKNKALDLSWDDMFKL